MPSPFDMQKLMDQVETMLEIDVPCDDPDRWLRIASDVAGSLRTEPFTISEARGGATNGGRRFTVAKRGARQSAFEVWVSREWTVSDEDKAPGMRTIYVGWDMQTLESLEASAESLGEGSAVAGLAKLAMTARKGIPGYDPYLTFLRTFQRTVTTEASPAQVHARLQTRHLDHDPRRTPTRSSERERPVPPETTVGSIEGEHVARDGNPSMSQARQQLIDEGVISGDGEDPPVPAQRTAEARCENCYAEVDGGDRFCRSCGTEIAHPEEPEVVAGAGVGPARSDGGSERAAGILEQVKSLDVEGLKRIVDKARQLAPRPESLDAANELGTREEAAACEYCFRRIRDVITENRLPGRRLAGTSVSEEVAVAQAGRNAALAYLLGDRLDEADRRNLLEPWLAAVGEPPATGDLVELALRDKNPQRADGSIRNPTSTERMAYWQGKSPSSLSASNPNRQAPASSSPGFRTQLSTNQQGHSGAKFIGDAALGESWTVRQVIDALCYMITGIAFMIGAFQPDLPGWLFVVGIAAFTYGIWVLNTDSYWVSTIVYLIAFLSVMLVFGAIF